MRPLGVTLAAGCEFLRAFLVGLVVLGVRFVGGVASRLAGLTFGSWTFTGFDPLAPHAAGVRFMRAAQPRRACPSVALPEARRYFESKENILRIPA